MCKHVIFKPLTVLSDSQDVFRAMHPDPDIVRLYLKPLLIGELAPEEPNQERNKNVSEVLGLRVCGGMGMRYITGPIYHFLWETSHPAWEGLQWHK